MPPKIPADAFHYDDGESPLAPRTKVEEFPLPLPPPLVPDAGEAAMAAPDRLEKRTPDAHSPLPADKAEERKDMPELAPRMPPGGAPPADAPAAYPAPVTRDRKAPKARKWRKSLVLASLLVGGLWYSNSPARDPVPDLSPPKPLANRLTRGTPNAVPYNPIADHFAQHLDGSTRELRKIRPSSANALVAATLCSFSPEALERLHRDMKSHVYAYGLADARVKLMTRCGDAEGLQQIYDELGNVRYTRSGAQKPVEVLVLREKIATTLSRGAKAESDKKKWAGKAEVDRAEREANPTRAVRNPAAEAADDATLRRGYAEELKRAHARHGAGSRESNGFSRMLGQTLRQIPSPGSPSRGPT